MYQRPGRSPRGAISRDDLDDADLRAAIADAINNDPDVRAAILQLIATARPARATRKPRPTITPPVRQTGRGR